MTDIFNSATTESTTTGEQQTQTNDSFVTQLVGVQGL